MTENYRPLSLILLSSKWITRRSSFQHGTTKAQSHISVPWREMMDDYWRWLDQLNSSCLVSSFISRYPNDKYVCNLDRHFKVRLTLKLVTWQLIYCYKASRARNYLTHYMCVTKSEKLGEDIRFSFFYLISHKTQLKKHVSALGIMSRSLNTIYNIIYEVKG